MAEVKEKSGEILLPIARASISTALGAPRQADESAPWLQEPAATFVTLKQDDQLRGCIGTLEPHRSLIEDVKTNAQAAAFRDTRFAPLTLKELAITCIEVSLLTPKEAIIFTNESHVYEQLRPDLDGVLIEYGHYKSTFLPQVWEQLPSPGEFMKQLKLKAGLPSNFWSMEMKVFRYQVKKWAEAASHGEAHATS